MKFIISETGWDYLERLAYRGCIGILYQTTLEGLLAYIIVGLLFLFAIIGVISTIKHFAGNFIEWAKYKNTFSYKHKHHKY